MYGVYRSLDKVKWDYVPSVNAVVTNTTSTIYNSWSGNFSDYFYSFTTRRLSNSETDIEGDYYYIWGGESYFDINKTIYFRVANAYMPIGEVFAITFRIVRSGIEQIRLYPSDITNESGEVVYKFQTLPYPHVYGYVYNYTGYYCDFYLSWGQWAGRSAIIDEYSVKQSGWAWLYMTPALSSYNSAVFPGYQTPNPYPQSMNFYSFEYQENASYPGWDGNPESTPPEEDFEWGDSTTPDVEGGEGNFDDTSDGITNPLAPSILLANMGIIKVYKLTRIQVMMFAQWLFATDIDSWSKLYTEPFDYITSLEYYPLPTTQAGVSTTISVGGVTLFVDCIQLYNTFNYYSAGSIDIEEYWGGYLDYAPHTKIQLFLPFYGFVDLNTDDVMDSTLSITYKVDLLSGVTLITLTVDKKNSELNSILYTYETTISMQLPLTSRDYSNMVSTVISSAAMLAAGAALTGGAGAAAGALGTATAAGTGGAMAGALGAVGNTIANSKPSVSRGGAMGGNSGIMGYLKPYVIISRPVQARPANYAELQGFTSEKYLGFSECEGFTIVKKCNLDNIPCTDSELDAIYSLLSSGVFF